MANNNYNTQQDNSDNQKDLYSTEAEEALLGGVLIDPGIFPTIGLQSSDFHDERNRWIWQAVTTLFEEGGNVDNIIIGDQLEKMGKFKEAGGSAYLAKLMTKAAEFFNVQEYAQIIRGFTVKRDALAIFNKGAKWAYSSNGKTADLGEIIRNLEKINCYSQQKPIQPGEPTTWEELAEIIKDITWAWQPWLPNGMVTILAGESGSGKSNLALRIAGCFLRGDPWPDGIKYKGETGLVLWCEAEAAQAIHLDRAKKWGLPVDKVLNLIDDAMQTDFDISNLDHRNFLTIRANHPDVKLIVIDSLSGATMGKGEKDSEMLEPIKFLAGLARDTGCPILVTHHLRKRGIFDLDGVNLERLRGSSAIVQAARLVWALDQPDPQAGDWLRLSVIKSNLAKFPDPVGMLIEDNGLRFGMAPTAPKIETVADKAADLLLALLDSEPLAYTVVENEFKSAGISEHSINRAKQKLGIVSIKKPEGWYWSLPARKDYTDD